MASLFHFGDTGLASAYFAFVFVTALGTLQIVAARERLVGLSLVGVDRPDGIGQVVGIGLIVGTAGWFFVGQWPLIFRPGLAGAELLVIFAGGALAAVLVSLAGASVVHARHIPPANPGAAFRRQVVTFRPDGAQGRLYLPAGAAGPWPAACLVPSPAGDPYRLDLLAGVLTECGIVTLVVDWRTASVHYPEVLAVVPAACEYLSRLSGVAGDRLAAVGFDLGADLVLRAASGDRQLRTAVALAPLVSEAASNVGLGLLREMTCWQAIRRRRWGIVRRLLRQLDVLDRLTRLAGRPVLVIYGAEDSLVTLDGISEWVRACPAGSLVTIPRATHLTLPERPSTARLVANWLKEHG
jgi:alpha-beta hydrolase superfamily lysophospholipase